MKCYNCGHEVIWQNDFDYSDYDLDGNGIISVYLCTHCGAYIEVYVEEKENEN